MKQSQTETTLTKGTDRRTTTFCGVFITKKGSEITSPIYVTKKRDVTLEEAFPESCWDSLALFGDRCEELGNQLSNHPLMDIVSDDHSGYADIVFFIYEGMRRISYGDLCWLFREHESKQKQLPYAEKTHLDGFIVFAQESFTQQYSIAARTYAVSSNNKAFLPNMGGYSIYGSSIDGFDRKVRLERYMRAEKGGKDGWIVEYCLIPRESAADV